MEVHPEYKFSVTVSVDDEAVLACLRGLAWYCQKTGNKQISWGGTKRNEWLVNGRTGKFHFDSASYRQNFISEFQRFFRKVKVLDQSNDDPAPRQGDRW
jgi:hypothetical protein